MAELDRQIVLRRAKALACKHPTFRPGDRVRLARTEICGTVLSPEQTRPQAVFTLVQWDDGKESWAEPESLEAIPRQ